MEGSCLGGPIRFRLYTQRVRACACRHTPLPGRSPSAPGGMDEEEFVDATSCAFHASARGAALGLARERCAVGCRCRHVRRKRRAANGLRHVGLGGGPAGRIRLLRKFRRAGGRTSGCMLRGRSSGRLLLFRRRFAAGSRVSAGRARTLGRRLLRRRDTPRGRRSRLRLRSVRGAGIGMPVRPRGNGTGLPGDESCQGQVHPRRHAEPPAHADGVDRVRPRSSAARRRDEGAHPACSRSHVRLVDLVEQGPRPDCAPAGRAR